MNFSTISSVFSLLPVEVYEVVITGVFFSSPGWFFVLPGSWLRELVKGCVCRFSDFPCSSTVPTILLVSKSYRFDTMDYYRHKRRDSNPR